jgi:NADP-dependent 3-hydroxy acid dehydrogenase YdfG
VHACARRTDRLQTLASQTGVSTMQLDVTDPASVERFCAAVERCNIVV